MIFSPGVWKRHPTGSWREAKDRERECAHAPDTSRVLRRSVFFRTGSRDRGERLSFFAAVPSARSNLLAAKKVIYIRAAYFTLRTPGCGGGEEIRKLIAPEAAGDQYDHPKETTLHRDGGGWTAWELTVLAVRTAFLRINPQTVDNLTNIRHLLAAA